MRERENIKQPFSDEFFFFIAASISCWLLYETLAPKVVRWWLAHERSLVFVAVASVLSFLTLIFVRLWNKRVDRDYLASVTAESATSVYVGRDEKGERLFIGETSRTQHTQLIGTTGSGKTESVVLPWAVGDIKRGAGVIIIDGKAESSFLDKLYAYTVRAGREEEFRLFSLAHVAQSSTFNPLQGTNPKQIAERVFSGFTFDNRYYRDIQYQFFEDCLSLVIEQGRVPTFLLIERLLTDMTLLNDWLRGCKNKLVRLRLEQFSKRDEQRRSQDASGLLAQISHFTSGKTSALFNCEWSGISFDEAVSNGLILYFQVPTMYYPFLAQATGKLVLQMLQNIISQRHLGLIDKSHFLSVFLDDFQDYMYEDFGSILNKPRSANTAVVLSHNSMGDLDKVGDGFGDIVSSCTNIKIVMKANDPTTAEYLANLFGTSKVEKKTERETKSILGKQRTGESSVRDAEVYNFHPNLIKTLPLGVGIVKFPHPLGAISKKVRFHRLEDIPKISVPTVERTLPDENQLLDAPPVNTPPDDVLDVAASQTKGTVP